MTIKKPEIPDHKIIKILLLLSDGKTWDDIVYEAVCHRGMITKVKQWFNSISWLEAKVYAEGNESILKVRKDYLKQKAKESQIKHESHKEASQFHLEKHFDELAEAAQALHHLRQIMFDASHQSIVVKEFLPYSIRKFTVGSAFSVTSGPGFWFSPPSGFLEHFCQEFPQIDLTSWGWLSPLPLEVENQLECLGNTATFKNCPTCQICKDLTP